MENVICSGRYEASGGKYFALFDHFMFAVRIHHNEIIVKSIFRRTGNGQIDSIFPIGAFCVMVDKG